MVSVVRIRAGEISSLSSLAVTDTLTSPRAMALRVPMTLDCRSSAKVSMARAMTPTSSWVSIPMRMPRCPLLIS